ncbi:MAG: dihydropteroate synthase [Candidatus Aegiribacteria sp.]|nr:dihydropteroate synthase [Candidatus Aegiribacteria sp.]MBD3295391.1 dihydropteroate synthase [Candidatus Fermentibacteria bacterium]
MRLRRLHLRGTDQWLGQLKLVGAERGTWSRLSKKNEILTFLVESIPAPAANILKQSMLSGGADAIVSMKSITCEIEKTRALVVGTEKQIRRGCDSLAGQPFGLSKLSIMLLRAIESPPRPRSTMSIGNKTLDFSEGPLIMGILNLTPDSFSDGGLYSSTEAAVEHAERMALQGAAIVDIGAESTRPGAKPVPASQQLDRIIPVLERLNDSFNPVISIDTRMAEVANASLAAGAEMVNDVSAFSDPEMANVVAQEDVPAVVMHMQGIPQNMQDDPVYRDTVGEIYDYLAGRIEVAEKAGIPRDRIFVDPGIGFGKRLENNLELISRLREFRWLGCRVLLGHSRKSFLGELTGIQEASRRDGVTHTITALSCGDADVVRVHDVEGTMQVIKVANRLRGMKC